MGSFIVTINSSRGGVGKTFLSSNLAFTIAKSMSDKRVALVDLDLGSPGLNVLYGIRNQEYSVTLSDYFLEKITNLSEIGIKVKECHNLTIFPASYNRRKVLSIMDKNKDNVFELFTPLFLYLTTHFDVIIFDTHPGINRYFLYAAGISNLVLFMLRHDTQDYQGTVISLSILKEIPEDKTRKIGAIISQVPKEKMTEAIEHCEVIKKKEYGAAFDLYGILPYSTEVAGLMSQSVFVSTYESGQVNENINAIAKKVILHFSPTEEKEAK